MPAHLQMEAQAQQRTRLREALCPTEIAREHTYSLRQTLHQVWHAYLIARRQHRDRYEYGAWPWQPRCSVLSDRAPQGDISALGRA
jgi:hypothetical protein